MKTARHFLAVAAFLIAPNLSATTQAGAEPGNSVSPSGIQYSDAELSPEVQLYVGRADELTSRLRYDDAAREYARAADVARREGHLPSGTSWQVATAYYNGGNFVSAAATLSQLANEAARVGDLEVEALALYYSAWLDAKAGRRNEMAASITRLEGLLRSRYMPVAIRDRLGEWLRTSRDVAVN